MLADRRPPSTLPPPAPALEDEEGVVNRDGGQQRTQNPKVVIITDSSHALDQIQRFLQGQPLRIRPTNSLIMDALTSVLLRLLFMDSVRLEFRKVKSHAGVEGNCRADGLARAAARAMAMAMPTPWDGDGLGGSWCGFTMVSVDDYLCLRGGGVRGVAAEVVGMEVQLKVLFSLSRSRSSKSYQESLHAQ